MPQPSSAPVPPSAAAARRQHRAAVAQQLLAEAEPSARALDWVMLDEAPPWLALSRSARGLFTRRVGAVLAGPALRLWIAAPQVAAAQAAVGADWWQALMVQAGWPPLPPQVAPWPDGAATDAEGVAGVLHEAGAAVLLATLPHGALRHAASQLLAPSAPLLMPRTAAEALLATALQIQHALATRPADGGGSAG
jgi:hypothetical protein